MTTKDEALQMALQSLEGMAADIGKFPNEVPAIAACREALAQKDEPHRGIPIDEYLARVYENPRRKAALERARERLEKLGEEEKAERPQKDEPVERGDATNLARRLIEDDTYAQITEKGVKCLCEAVMRMDAALEQKDEQEPIGEARAYESTTRYTHCIWDANVVPVGTKLYTAPPECRLLTEKEICHAWLYATGYDIENGDSTESRTVHISPDEILEFARIVEGSLGVDHDAQP